MFMCRTDQGLFSEHSHAVYPKNFMSMNFNLWFMPKGADGSQGPVESAELREYQEDIDWAFHMADRALSTAEVETLVTDFRKNKIAYVDRVAEQNPPLPSPCGL
jgi:elongation factor P hydroxylase